MATAASSKVDVLPGRYDVVKYVQDEPIVVMSGVEAGDDDEVVVRLK